jgi:nucleoside-diphosphate-sugar epimerase
MKVLFVGGTGNLSLPASEEALRRGFELVHLNRGRSGPALPGVETLHADVTDEDAARRVIGTRSFDAVVDFIAYGQGDVERSIRLFGGICGQYVFLSSSSAYRKPPKSHLIVEDLPLGNTYWAYSRDKIAAEESLTAARAGGFPSTIVRPGHSYGRSWVPTPFGSSDFTIVGRMLAGKEVPVPGDGQAMWTITHARDFAVGLVGLIGREEALGEAFNIAGDEALTWDEIYAEIGRAFGVEPRLVHVPVEIIARAAPDFGEKILGDKGWSTLFDCSKLRRLVPEFRSTIRFAEGMRQSADWLMANSGRRHSLLATETSIEAILAAWKRTLSA